MLVERVYGGEDLGAEGALEAILRLRRLLRDREVGGGRVEHLQLFVVAPLLRDFIHMRLVAVLKRGGLSIASTFLSPNPLNRSLKLYCQLVYLCFRIERGKVRSDF